MERSHDANNCATAYQCNESSKECYLFQMIILEALISEGFCPNVIRNGRKFKLLSIDELNVRVIPSHNYFPGDEFELAHLFGINYESHYFPYKFFKETKIDYVGRIPDFHYFVSTFDNGSVKAKKFLFYEQNKCQIKWSLLKMRVI